jgi:hypothetical protein
MVYRFLTIDNADVELSFSRDCDSRINKRDQYCINKFIESNKKFQIIRDNIQHNTRIPGGMWGIKQGLLHTKVKDLLLNYHGNEINDDQLFLGSIVYPLVVNDAIVFDEFFNYQSEYREKIDVPYEEIYGRRDFVGNVHMPINLNYPFGEHGAWYEL